jgi:hypothetical protein
LPDTGYVRSNIWIYAKEYAHDRVYHGGKAGGTKIISFEVNAIEGGLDAEAKKQFIAFLTEAVRKGRYSAREACSRLRLDSRCPGSKLGYVREAGYS